MKKSVLFLIGLFLVVISTTFANTTKSTNRNQPINFVENGIAFSVFTNGNFNYNTNVFTNRNGRRFRQNIFIDRDFRGRIVLINNVPICYDKWDNVTRIGDVIMQYNRGRIVNVGHMNISYNRFGNPVFFGNVRNNININVNLNGVYGYNDVFFSRRDFRRNYSQFRRDRNFIYYRNNANNVIRRRVANKVSNNNTIRNRNNGNRIYRENNSIRKNNNVVKKNNRNTTVRRGNTSSTNRKTAVTRSSNKKRNINRRSSSTTRKSR